MTAAADCRPPEGTPGEMVVIYSGQWGAYWRPNAAGYTTRIEEAGIYTRAAAIEHTSHCGPEKRIEIRHIAHPPAAHQPREAADE